MRLHKDRLAIRRWFANPVRLTRFCCRPDFRRALTPSPERLEDRQMLSTMAGEFPGLGVWRYMNSTGWQQLTAANATVLDICDRGSVTGEFPGYGVWRYMDSTGWQQLATADATSIDIDCNGDIAGEFPGMGVWRFEDATGWQQLTAADSISVGINDHGDVVGEFPGLGVWRFEDATGWQQLTSIDATMVSVDGNARVVGEFPRIGVFRFGDSTGWQQLTSAYATSICTDTYGDVVGAFPGMGVWRFEDARGWQQLTGSYATTVSINCNSEVTGAFPGYGVWSFTDSMGWQQMTGLNASIIAHARTVDDPVADQDYVPVYGTLFGSNGPSYLDVHQSDYLGDCWLVAGLAEVAARDPSDIRSMFTDLGSFRENGSWVEFYDVRFYNNAGAPVHVIVDTELPAGGQYYDQVDNGILWVALAEKAYAEANGAGYVTTGQVGSDSYAALNGGSSAWLFQAVTGKPASDYYINGDTTSIAAAWNAGELVCLGSSPNANDYLIVGDSEGTHAYAMIGYNPGSSTPFELYNPWGKSSVVGHTMNWNGNVVYDGPFWISSALVSLDFATQNFGTGTATGLDDHGYMSLVLPQVPGKAHRATLYHDLALDALQQQDFDLSWVT